MSFVQSVPAAEVCVSAVLRRYPQQAIPLIELSDVLIRSGDCAFTSEQREILADIGYRVATDALKSQA